MFLAVAVTVIDELVLLLNSVLLGRERVLLDINVPADKLDDITKTLPCMKAPTISRLEAHGKLQGYAVRVAVPRSSIASLLPQLKQAGASDLVVSAVKQLVP